MIHLIVKSIWKNTDFNEQNGSPPCETVIESANILDFDASGGFRQYDQIGSVCPTVFSHSNDKQAWVLKNTPQLTKMITHSIW